MDPSYIAPIVIGTIFGLLFVCSCVLIGCSICWVYKRRQQQLQPMNYPAAVVGQPTQFHQQCTSASAYPTVSFTSSDQSITIHSSCQLTDSPGFYCGSPQHVPIPIQTDNIYAENRSTNQFPSQSSPEPPPAYKDVDFRF